MEKVSPTCPRCGSSNTKFCYYNNYSLTQPRYFCKGCRRYWTRGGSLRNVPIGGGCQKSRRGKSVRVTSRDVSTRSYGQNGVESSSSLSAVRNDAVNSTSIDLAEIYANFLNPKPQTETRMEALALPESPEGINNVTQSFDQCRGLQMNDQLSSHLTHGNFATHLLGNESTFGFSGNLFSSVNSKSNFALPPLPDVVVSEGLLWPSSILPNEVLHSTNPMTTRLVEPSGQNSKMLNASNVSPFSPLNLEAIFRS